MTVVWLTEALPQDLIQWVHPHLQQRPLIHPPCCATQGQGLCWLLWVVEGSGDVRRLPHYTSSMCLPRYQSLSLNDHCLRPVQGPRRKWQSWRGEMSTVFVTDNPWVNLPPPAPISVWNPYPWLRIWVPADMGMGTNRYCRYGNWYRSAQRVCPTTIIYNPSHSPAQLHILLSQAVLLPAIYPCPSPNPSYSKPQDITMHLWTAQKADSEHETEQVFPC